MFFHDSEDRLHVGRICGVLYVIGIAPGCLLFHDAYCYAGIAVIAGWCLCFGAKQRKSTFREMFHPLGIVGIILIVLGVAGQFYFTRRH